MNDISMDIESWWSLISPWLLKAAVAVVIFIVGLWVVKRLKHVATRVLTRAGLDELLNAFLSKVVYWLGTVIVVMAALDQVGLNLTSAFAILGAAGLALGLALKDSLSNVASGVMLIMFRPFEVGQYVEAAGVGGMVKEVSLFSTILITPDNRKVVVPNAQIYNNTITNFSAQDTRRIDLTFGIGYDDDIDKARGLIEQALADNTLLLTDPAPQIAVSELADSSVNFVVRPWVKTDDYWNARFALTENIKKSFDQNGVSIPFPQRDIHVYQERAA